MDATLDDDLRDFEDLLSLLPPTDPLDSQISALTQQPTVSTTTTPTANRPQHDPSLSHYFKPIQLSQ